jgi:hypothetical protein
MLEGALDQVAALVVLTLFDNRGTHYELPGGGVIMGVGAGFVQISTFLLVIANEHGLHILSMLCFEIGALWVQVELHAFVR